MSARSQALGAPEAETFFIGSSSAWSSSLGRRSRTRVACAATGSSGTTGCTRLCAARSIPAGDLVDPGSRQGRQPRGSGADRRSLGRGVAEFATPSE